MAERKSQPTPVCSLAWNLKQDSRLWLALGDMPQVRIIQETVCPQNRTKRSLAV